MKGAEKMVNDCEHNQLKLEALGRFELPTCGLGNRRSIHLSYRAKTFFLFLPSSGSFGFAQDFGSGLGRPLIASI